MLDKIDDATEGKTRALSQDQIDFEKRAAELAANVSAEANSLYRTIIDPQSKPQAIELAPDLAALIWKNNKRNRDFQFSKAKMFASLAARGEFVYTHQGIAFYPDGQLFDGQHRIAGVILSGVTVAIQSTPNMKPEALLAIDMSKPRTAGDALQLEGIAFGNEKGRMAKAVLAYEHRFQHGEKLSDLSAAQVAEFVRANDVLLQNALETGGRSRDKVQDAPIDKMTAAIAIALMLRGGYSLSIASAFIAAVQYGVAQSENDPVLVLNKRLIKARLSEKKRDHMSPIEKTAALMRAASAWKQGLKVSRIEWRLGKEPLPSPSCPADEPLPTAA